MPIPPQTPAPTPPAPVEQLPGTPDVPITTASALQSQLRLLEAQLNVLLGQREGLQVQLRMVRGGIERANINSQLRQVNGEIAKAMGDIENVRTQIAIKQGTYTSQPVFPPPGTRNNGLNGDQVTAVFIVFLLAVAMPMSLGITRWLFRRSPRGTSAPQMDIIAPRLDRLEQAVDSIAIEIERISEGQRFVTKVLVERPVVVRPAGTPEADPSNLAGGEAFRALGAGPMEQIRIPERQAVRPSITPH